MRLALVIDADIRALEALAQQHDKDEDYLQAPFRLSRAIREACGDERLNEIFSSLSRQTLRYTQLGLATPARRKESARSDSGAATRGRPLDQSRWCAR